MSYTSPDELLSDPLLAASESLGALAAPIKARLMNASEYNDEHIATLKVLLMDITAMQIRLWTMAQEVR